MLVDSETFEITLAERTAALDALESLVAYVRRVGGFMRQEDQDTLRRAERVLVECGR